MQKRLLQQSRENIDILRSSLTDEVDFWQARLILTKKRIQNSISILTEWPLAESNTYTRKLRLLSDVMQNLIVSSVAGLTEQETPEWLSLAESVSRLYEKLELR